MSVNFRFTWQDRLHRQADFSRVIRKGRRFSQNGLVLWVAPSSDTPARPRLGLAVPKAYGNAVERNRMKRLLRESFRLNKSKLRPADMVFSARTWKDKPRFQTVEPVVLSLWNKAGLFASSQ